MASDLHPSWTWLIDWLRRMSKRFTPVTGAVVDLETGKRWDWGQAICRDVYGADWCDSPEFKAADQPGPGDPCPDALLDAARRWEAGEWPTWAREEAPDA